MHKTSGCPVGGGAPAVGHTAALPLSLTDTATGDTELPTSRGPTCTYYTQRKIIKAETYIYLELSIKVSSRDSAHALLTVDFPPSCI